MRTSISISIFSILIFISCKTKISNDEFEKRVFNEVFVNIVDSAYIDDRFYDNILTIDELKVPQFITEIVNIENDSLDLIIAMEERFSDVSNIKSKKFIFKDINELPKDIELHSWKKKYKKFIGAMSFSKITFDESKNNGEIEVSFRCGGKCGQGYKFYLKKENGNWKVVRKDETWIS